MFRIVVLIKFFSQQSQRKKYNIFNTKSKFNNYISF